MNSDTASLAAIANGFRIGRERLEALRIAEIRESDIRLQLPSFNGLFEHALRNGLARQPKPLGKAMRVFLKIDK